MEAASISRTSFPPMDRSRWLESTGGQAALSRRPEPVSYDRLRFERVRGNGEDGELLSAGAAHWGIVQRVDDPDARRANAQAQEDVANGATGLAIVFEGAPNAFGYGLPARPEALVAALHGIPMERIYLRIDVHPASRASVDWIVEIMRRKKVDPARLNLSFGIDPAAVMTALGRLRMSVEALRASMPQSLAHFFAMGLPAILLEADGRVLHNAGATEAQELGLMLASAVSHLRLFEEARQPLIYAIPHIGFAMCADQDQFLSVAKIMALRRLWRRAQEVSGLPPSRPKIHVETSYRMMTRADPDTNVLRSTMAAYAAAAADADTISVLPHTLPHGLPDGTARRIARNTQLVLAGESHLNLFGHPNSGTEDLDLLTASLCEAAWEEFRQIEAEGGLLESLSKGHLQARVIQARDERVQLYARRERPVVGVTANQARSEAAVRTLRAERRPVPEDGIATCDPLPVGRTEELLREVS
jgi:methylmalonyl-CoA mutase